MQAYYIIIIMILVPLPAPATPLSFASNYCKMDVKTVELLVDRSEKTVMNFFQKLHD